jgi:hypothetical protein
VTLEDFRALIEDLDVPEAAKARLRDLQPETYVGLAPDLARDVD